MKRSVLLGAALACGLGLALLSAWTGAGAAPAISMPEWHMNATVIEACSCPMFCQCYFNTKPAAHGGHEGHGEEHFCRANNAYKINKGNYGETKLNGAKFWIAADLGGDFASGKLDWAVVYFDKATTLSQREGIKAILPKLFPFEWNSMTFEEGTIDTWKYDKDSAHATLDGGKTAEVKLKRFPGMTDEPVVIQNLKYWGAPRNDGFVLMPNEVEAYRVGPKAFEFKNTNGFMLTLDMSSKDLAG